MRPIFAGRTEKDLERFGEEGLALLGKHFVSTGGKTNLANEIFIDLIKPHVIFVCGKRGMGKSYTLGTIAEGIHLLPNRIKKNLSCVMVDTMGIYWTMKYPNHRDEELLNTWNLSPSGIDCNILVPVGWCEQFKELGIPYDREFSFIPGELNAQDWCKTFGIEQFSALGVVIERAVKKLKADSGIHFSIDDIIDKIKSDERAATHIKDSLESRFEGAKEWGIFHERGTPMTEIAMRGKVNIIDASLLPAAVSGFSVKALVIGIIGLKLLECRMLTRKVEELSYLSKHNIGEVHPERVKIRREDMIPMTWYIIDEAHQYCPNPKEGTTPATEPLIRIMREGRQPGITLVVATQQPGKIHTDVHSQCDIVLSHRITAMPDAMSLNSIMGSYMVKGLDDYIRKLPKMLGAAILLDDSNEKVLPMRTRPRISWHGGESSWAMEPKKKKDEFSVF
jgi:hypothetical protein